MSSRETPTARPSERLLALDRLRGLAMILMALDHASDVFNRHAFAAHVDSFATGADGASLYVVDGNPLHFLTRWVTHLCAPAFVLLAGAALALSVARRTERGDSARAIDRHLVGRGLFLVACELWMSVGFGVPVVQVLYAIGGSIVALALLRRFPAWALVAAAGAWFVVGEGLVEGLGLRPEPGGGAGPTGLAPQPLWAELLFVNGVEFTGVSIPLGFTTLPPVVMFLYPLVPWLAVMLLGWGLGHVLVVVRGRGRGQAGFERRLAGRLFVGGALALVLFFEVRSTGGYGNFWIGRGDDDPLRWLQVSKYPPSFAFVCLTVGAAAILLAGFFRFGRGEGGLLALLGRNALFFYLVHVHLMVAVRLVVWDGPLYQSSPFGLAGAWVGAAGVVAVLAPACAAYERWKRRNPRALLARWV